jgi:hypothetical protein
VSETMISIADVLRISDLTAHETPTLAFRAIDELAEKLFDHRLFTVTRSILETMEVERIYSSNTDAYPIGGRKQKRSTPWGEQVLDRGQILVCHGPADIRRVFADHELIISLGITAMINVPIFFAGRSVATMNMSHADDRFGVECYPDMRLFATMLLPLVLAGATG